ncbi:MAG: hypothetical protein ISR64_11155 [Deltaproteobacteria bacterium]|nr:hypothetical protein [Deltaproteobacteria bacterium]
MTTRALILAALLLTPVGLDAAESNRSPLLPDRLEPYRVATEDGTWSLRFALAAQVQYSFASRDDESDIRIRRLRPVFSGSLGLKELTWKLHLNVVPGSLEFMDFYVDYQALPDLRIRVGVFKIPFTRYRIQSFQRLTLVDWSILTGYVGAERQLGFTFHNGYEKPQAIEYVVGVFTGQNTRGSHAVKLTGLYGVTAPNRSDLTGPDPFDGLHPEIVARVGYNHGGIDTRADTDFQGGPVRFSAGLSAAWDIRPERFQDLALRIAPEVLLKAHGFSMSALACVGLVQMGDDLTDMDMGLWGVQAQASYLAASRFELSVRYAFLQVLDALRKDVQANGIAGETDDLEHRHELSAGFNVYLVGHQFKWQTDFAWLPQTRPGGTLDEYRFRTQVQVSF